MRKFIAILLLTGFTAMGASAADRSFTVSSESRTTVTGSETQETATTSGSSTEENHDLYFDGVEVEEREVQSESNSDALQL